MVVARWVACRHLPYNCCVGGYIRVGGVLSQGAVDCEGAESLVQLPGQGVNARVSSVALHQP